MTTNTRWIRLMQNGWSFLPCWAGENFNFSGRSRDPSNSSTLIIDFVSKEVPSLPHNVSLVSPIPSSSSLYLFLIASRATRTKTPADKSIPPVSLSLAIPELVLFGQNVNQSMVIVMYFNQTFLAVRNTSKWTLGLWRLKLQISYQWIRPDNTRRWDNDLVKIRAELWDSDK